MLDTLLYYGTGFLLYSMMWALPSLFIAVVYLAQQSLAHGTRTSHDIWYSKRDI
ncbi:hypothetical protein S14_139 [Shewanella sp. phage 1/4]|uniref:hypothetical protein n=1 Tax=Shewanella phage 1/4 TaxID=1458859 RepID=UPI0004F80DBF|nr:hypothetical protein S14_139 [Shewanella sp. phage 1/4]AHK11248.1 hypothetical protein S14_139 [Shewanella sp. phage 1/4]